MTTLADLNTRSLEIFKELVDTYMETGEPVGSRTLSRRLGTTLSPATIRNIMADLEEAGLLYAPHTSAGRLPTDAGLRLFVHGLIQVGEISEQDRQTIEASCQAKGRSLTAVIEEATSVLSGLSKCAGLVMAPKVESPLKHLEFVPLGTDKALVIIITQDGFVENRILELPPGLLPSMLVEASNYINYKLVGKTLSEAHGIIAEELVNDRNQLNRLSGTLVAEGIGVWAGEGQSGSLIIKGQSQLLKNVTVMDDLDRLRQLFSALDTKESLKTLLEGAIKADGVQIFIGSESPLFNQSGCSMVVAPYQNSTERVVGAIGVVGPGRMNYGKIIPLVDYTAKIVSRLLG